MEQREMLKESSHRTIADKSYVQALVRKWGELLEGISNPYTKGVTAVLMENESQWLQNLEEETKSINVGSFTKFIFPVLRRVFPNLIANEIVSVQPMTSSIGAVFFFDYKYASSKGKTTAGNIFPRDFDRDYSSEYVNSEPLATADGTNYGGAGTAATWVLSWTPVRSLDAANGYSVVIAEVDAVTGLDVATQVCTDNGTGGFSGGSAGTINYSNGTIAAFKFTAAPTNLNKIVARYTYNGELNTKIPTVQLDITKQPIVANPRRLKALWSSEAAEDLRSFHGLDAETELVSGVAQEIALEIDREVINDLFVNSTGRTDSFSVTPPAGINQLDHLRSMITKISTISNLIHKDTLRAPANFIVTSPEISAQLSQLTTHGDFRPLWVSGGASPYGPADMPRPLTQHGQFGIYKVGTLMNKWVIYEDPFFDSAQMLIGLKGATFLDAGYVWAPYIPLQVTPTFLDPSDMGFRKGLRTRYGKQVLRSSYYGRLTVTGL